MSTRAVAFAIAGVFIALGAAAAIFPGFVVTSSRHLVSPAGIYVAAALRVVMGIALLFIARRSRAPGILRIIGVALLAMGIVLPILGVDSASARIAWEAEHLMFLRMEGALFIWAGIIIYQLAQPRSVPG